MARCRVPHLDPPPIGLRGGRGLFAPPQIGAAFVGGFLPQPRPRATTASSPRGDRRRSRSRTPTLSQWSPSSVEARSGTVMARSEKEDTDGDFQDGGADLVQEDILKVFLIERQLHGDVLSKISDQIWKGSELKVLNVAHAAYDSSQVSKKVEEDENSGGFFKLIQTQLWISGDSGAPSNRKLGSKEWQNDSEKRKTINLLKYTALKRELLLLTTGIGAACTGYILLTFSIEAAISYATGVLFSCLYLQLLYYHTDNLSAESIPQVFLKKKIKKIGIRSDDLQYAFEKTVKGSRLALSSPRLVIPAAIYGLWWILHNNFSSFFDFQLVTALLGVFAYKAAALVQVYRDNENLRMIFPEDEGPSS